MNNQQYDINIDENAVVFFENSGQDINVVPGTCDFSSANSPVINKPRNVYNLKINDQKCFGLSPISELSINLEDTNIATPKSSRPDNPILAKRLKLNKLKKSNDVIDPELETFTDVDCKAIVVAAIDNNDKNVVDVYDYNNASEDTGEREGKDTKGAEVKDDEDDKSSADLSLITNTFTINSGGRSPATRRAEQRALAVHRRLNIQPLRMNYDVKCDSPDKENMSTEDLSFYCGNSPQSSPRPCSISPCMDDIGLLSPETSPTKFTVTTLKDQNNVTIIRQRLEDNHDPNSMDSGYGASYTSIDTNHNNNVNNSSLIINTNELTTSAVTTRTSITETTTISNNNNNKASFRFAEPFGVAPKRASNNSFSVFNSLSSGSMESIDDYMELFEMESIDDNAQLPNGLNSLISGDIKSIRTTPETARRPLVRRCLSMNDNNVVINNKVRTNLFDANLTPKSMTGGNKDNSSAITPEKFLSLTECNLTPYASKTLDVNGRCFKRPEPPVQSPIQSKRYKSETNYSTTLLNDNDNKRPVLKKSMSLNDANIMSALSRSSSEPDLIGDFSKSFCLPLMDGRHQDLKSISPETMAAVLRGDFDNSVESYKVIDCRYPYEFDGGHIRGAENLYTQEQILEKLVDIKTETPKVDSNKRNILIFHCEFSSERGPKLSRFLRNNDRMRNTDSYPALHYPEIYLLHGGYKDFFQTNSDLCDPVAYRPMLDPSYGEAYKHFRAKSKSWNGDTKSTVNRLVKSRSRLVL